MAAVDQDRELDRARPAQIVQGVERGAHRPARVQHVVDQDDRLAVHPAGREFGPAQRAGRMKPQVIPVHGHIEGAAGDVEALELADPRREAPGQRHSARRDAEQDDPVTAVRPFQDLVSDPGQRPPDFLGVEHREAITPRDRITGRTHRSDLLPRLTGRSLKDVYVEDHTGSYRRCWQLCAPPANM